jgi:hypothetical protein
VDEPEVTPIAADEPDASYVAPWRCTACSVVFCILDEKNPNCGRTPALEHTIMGPVCSMCAAMCEAMSNSSYFRGSIQEDDKRNREARKKLGLDGNRYFE